MVFYLSACIMYKLSVCECKRIFTLPYILVKTSNPALKTQKVAFWVSRFIDL